MKLLISGKVELLAVVAIKPARPEMGTGLQSHQNRLQDEISLQRVVT
jgi:hypothetical protein